MRKKIFSDVFFNVILQLSIIASGVVLPHFIINYYGSAINGMIASITQFLSYITLLEVGIGGVIKSQLYKPILNKDTNAISSIIKASNNFYRKIGIVFVIYLLIMAGSYKFIANLNFDWTFVFMLVIILGIGMLAQYLIGATYQTAIQSAQHYTFTSLVQIITLWLNVALSILCIKSGGTIHSVKLITAFLFSTRPICYFLYAKRKYKLKGNVVADKKALAQRWDGFGHHIAYFIHSNTDIVLLTIFASLEEVSVYSVYLMVVVGVKAIIGAISSAFEPYFGRLIAINDKEKLREMFGVYEFAHYLFSTILFSTTLVLIVPFVKIYTEGITDVDYIRVIFSVFLVLAEFWYCLRTPYSIIVFSAGHFKETKKGAFVEAFINIFISLILIKPLGLIGVAIGTFIAMIFRTTEYAVYLSKNILKRNFKYYLLKSFAAIITLLIMYIASFTVNYSPQNYLTWVAYAFLITISSAIVSFVIYGMIDFTNFKKCIIIIFSKIKIGKNKNE